MRKGKEPPSKVGSGRVLGNQRPDQSGSQTSGPLSSCPLTLLIVPYFGMNLTRRRKPAHRRHPPHSFAHQVFLRNLWGGGQNPCGFVFLAVFLIFLN